MSHIIERLNPFEYYETEFLKRYRFTKVVTQDLIRTLQHQLERSTTRSHAVPVHLQVTAALQFYKDTRYKKVGIQVCPLPPGCPGGIGSDIKYKRLKRSKDDCQGH